MVEGWYDALHEAELILQGKKLIPYWRPGDNRDLNLKRVFFEPREFDLVLWVQGSAAVPYLEDGPSTSAETWRQLQRLFNGQLGLFAIWFN